MSEVSLYILKDAVDVNASVLTSKATQRAVKGLSVALGKQPHVGTSTHPDSLVRGSLGFLPHIETPEWLNRRLS